MPERIAYTTDDGVRIVGDWTPAPTMHGAALLLHAMPDTRQSFIPLVTALVRRGIGCLAIDLRGHGESTRTVNGQNITYTIFTDEQHQDTAIDVRMGLEWLKGRGIESSRIMLCGASIGADLALGALADDPSLFGAVLLSPGPYHGMPMMEFVENLASHQHIYIVTARSDVESAQLSQEMAAALGNEQAQLTVYPDGGHGIELFRTDARLIEQIAAWTTEAIQG